MEDVEQMAFDPPTARAHIVKRATGIWVTCPECGKAQFRVSPDTKISNLIYQCKNTKCKYNMLVMV